MCFMQFKNSMMSYYFVVVVDEIFQYFFQVKQFRLIVIECYYVDIEGGLQLSVGIQVV